VRAAVDRGPIAKTLPPAPSNWSLGGGQIVAIWPPGPFFRVLTGPGWAPSGDPPSDGPKAAIAWTSVKTVDNHLMTVREKFKIDDTGICLSESYKRGLIKY
jgi:hypothetical protein